MLFGDPRLPPRFWNKVRINTDTECWEWTGSKQYGYGRFHVRGLPRMAHRIAWQALVGEIARGLQIDHLCARDGDFIRRSCCNPAHLEPVTPRINALRSGAGKIGLSMTHCKRGHPFDESNARVRARSRTGNERVCRECNLRRSREFKARVKAQQAQQSL